MKGLIVEVDQKMIVTKIQFNRQLVAAKMNVNGEDLITVHQEHSARVVVVDSSFDTLTKADAIVTNTPNLAISVLTADCLPVLFADKKNNVIGVAMPDGKVRSTGF